MIVWIWDYGNILIADQLDQEASKPHGKPHGQRRRVDKPILHQVLHTAKFET
ncbi:MAG: hypothetical protein ALECFALPRED_008205 [Alectoria fallacina]|uniref:Uncharacterized protein n=1 Tax=Alectoria fallacina TaxID=1903189 RepID=A0A8H3PFR0_9LECA|nr:MAG: hypothetical protein ALECFALPRED_008205 [Alectoria fallacina]